MHSCEPRRCWHGIIKGGEGQPLKKKELRIKSMLFLSKIFFKKKEINELRVGDVVDLIKI